MVSATSLLNKWKAQSQLTQIGASLPQGAYTRISTWWILPDPCGGLVATVARQYACWSPLLSQEVLLEKLTIRDPLDRVTTSAGVVAINCRAVCIS